MGREEFRRELVRVVRGPWTPTFVIVDEEERMFGGSKERVESLRKKLCRIWSRERKS